MDILRRLFRRRSSDGPAAASTALDIGTEYAKALVFTTDADGEAEVTGVGRQRQGLSHMQSGTVADIPAVVRNCRVALDEAEAMAGMRSTSVVIGIAGELVKGFTTSLSVERRRPESTITEAERVSASAKASHGSRPQNRYSANSPAPPPAPSRLFMM